MTGMTIERWVRQGRNEGWCGPIICLTCDGTPATDLEIDDAECVYVIRVYETVEQRHNVEATHPPSVWRGL